MDNPVSYLYTGIFKNERILQLLYIIQQLGDRCFQKLNEVASEGHPSGSEYVHRFRLGLESILSWKTDVRVAEANQAIRKYPEIVTLYKYAIVYYIQEVYKQENTTQIDVSIPPFHDFLHSYYTALSRSSCMQRLEYFNVYGLERTHVHIEALRAALIECTKSATYRPSNVYDTEGIVGLVNVEKDITPWDSVSQRGGMEYDPEPQVLQKDSYHPKFENIREEKEDDNDNKQTEDHSANYPVPSYHSSRRSVLEDATREAMIPQDSHISQTRRKSSRSNQSIRSSRNGREDRGSTRGSTREPIREPDRSSYTSAREERQNRRMSTRNSTTYDNAYRRESRKSAAPSDQTSRTINIDLTQNIPQIPTFFSPTENNVDTTSHTSRYNQTRSSHVSSSHDSPRSTRSNSPRLEDDDTNTRFF